MKTKLLLVAAAALGLSFAAEAQTVSIGPRVGVNFATMRAVGGEKEYREEMNEMAEPITGAQFGIVANLNFSETFSVQPELLYSQKGVKLGADLGMGESLEIELKKNYLEVPVLAKMSFGTGEFQGFLTAGPYFGYWMSGKTRLELMGNVVEEDYEFSDDYEGDGLRDNRLDLGASIGVGAAYRVGPGAINLDVRYGIGFSDSYKYVDGRPEDESKSSNRVLGVSLAYLFGGK